MTEPDPATSHNRPNPARTALHWAEMDARRQSLQEFFHTNLPSGTEFVWEIGCGHGHFLTAYAQAFSDRYCLGIDTSSDRIERGARKAARAGLKNLHFVHTEAELFLTQLPPAARLRDVFILFPDPWPKKRHHKNRIVRADFLTALAKRAGRGTHLYFRTDYTPYLEEVRQILRSHADWELADVAWPFEYETVFQSRADSFGSLIARRRTAPA
ncbi:MAG: tRNA (guanosine(46)-N7)-methyltransferase TrmB [Rhodospirillaceae bacterium]